MLVTGEYSNKCSCDEIKTTNSHNMHIHGRYVAPTSFIALYSEISLI